MSDDYKKLYKLIEKHDCSKAASEAIPGLIKYRDNIKNKDTKEKVQYEISFASLNIDNSGHLKNEMEWFYEDGTSSKCPDYENFTNTCLDYLEKRVQEVKNILFKSRYALILWRLRKNFEYLKLAIDSYVDLLDALLLQEKNNSLEHGGIKITKCAQILFVLAIESNKTKYRFNEIKDKILYLLNEFKFQDENIAISKIHLIELMVEKKKYFNNENFNNLTKYCFKFANERINCNFTIAFIKAGKNVDKILKQKSYDWDRVEAEYYETMIVGNDFS